MRKGFPFGPRSELLWYRLKDVMGGGVTKPSPEPFGGAEGRARRVTLPEINKCTIRVFTGPDNEQYR